MQPKDYNPKVKETETRQLNKKPTNQMSRKLKQGTGIKYNPKVKETVARRLNKEQPKGQRNCSEASEEITNRGSNT